MGCVTKHTPLDINHRMGEDWIMDFKLYQEMSKRTMPKPVEGVNHLHYFRESITNYTLGLSGETGEVVDYLKKVLYHGHAMDELKLKHEIGDVMHYIAGLCTMFGFSMEECATLNVVKLQERYPDGFSVEDSVNRRDNK
jgi:NTP pyrophosphatase (non-canonical NTP hydrolase)